MNSNENKGKTELKEGDSNIEIIENMLLPRKLIKSGSSGLEQHIINVASKIEKLVLKVHGLEVPEDFKPSPGQISLVADHLFSNIFSDLTKKLRNIKIYDKEELLLYVKNTLEIYLNGLEAIEEDKVKIGMYLSVEGNNGFVDIFDKDREGRKTYYKNEEFNKLFGIKSDNKNIVSDLCYKSSDFQEISEKSGFICVGNILDGGNYIIHFDGLNEFQKEIIKKMFDKIIDVVKEKLNSIDSKYIDRLTGCKNSAYFNEHSKEKKWSVIAIDMDEFKPINDNFGHQSGDEVLKKVGKLLRSCTRKNEVVRMGGDEFCIMIKHDKQGHSPDIIKKILSRLEHLKNKRSLNMNLLVPGEQYEKEIAIKFSLGVCENEKEKLNLEEGYRIADQKMLESKISEKSDDAYIYRFFSNLRKFSKEKQKSLLTLLANKLGFDIVFK